MQCRMNSSQKVSRSASCLPKLTFYWYGPFRVVLKIFGILYKVNSDRNEKVVHCNCIKSM